MSQQKKSFRKYFLLIAFLIGVALFPVCIQEKMQVKAISLLSPLLRKVDTLFQKPSPKESVYQEVLRYENENEVLRLEIFKLRALLEQARVEEEIVNEKKIYLKEGLLKRYEEANFLLHHLQGAVPARVIFRDPAHFTSSLWISVGEETNSALKWRPIQKNSPVVLGRAIVGVIDYVGKRQSRVRLITDGGLKPSVRATRGFSQNLFLKEQVAELLKSLRRRNDLPLDETRILQTKLEELKLKLSDDNDCLYLAKGIVQGQGTPLWRSMGNKLRGIGFNYDFDDEEGSYRDLRSKSLQPLLRVGDLLITTGMDGVFPAGLRVGEVTHVGALREGAYSYELEAKPIIKNIHDISTLFVIPPLGFNPEDI